MIPTQKSEAIHEQQLRLWPGVVAVVVQWLLWLVVPIVAPEATLYGVIGGLVCGLPILLWWLFFSRAPRVERWGAVVLMIVAAIATSRIIDKSIATGAMGFMFLGYVIPVLSLALVAAAGRTGGAPGSAASSPASRSPLGGRVTTARTPRSRRRRRARGP